MISGGGLNNPPGTKITDPGYAPSYGPPSHGEKGVGKKVSGYWGCGETGVLFAYVTETGICGAIDSPSIPLLPDFDEDAYEGYV